MTTLDEARVTVRTNLPYREAMNAALAEFEPAYVDALMRRHSSLLNASRASGLAVDELIAIIGRLRDGTEPVLARAA